MHRKGINIFPIYNYVQNAEKRKQILLQVHFGSNKRKIIFTRRNGSKFMQKKKKNSKKKKTTSNTVKRKFLL